MMHNIDLSDPINREHPLNRQLKLLYNFNMSGRKLSPYIKNLAGPDVPVTGSTDIYRDAIIDDKDSKVAYFRPDTHYFETALCPAMRVERDTPTTIWARLLAVRDNIFAVITPIRSGVNSYRGWDPFHYMTTSEDGAPHIYKWHLISHWGNGDAIAVRTPAGSAKNDWHTIAFTYNGSGDYSGVMYYASGDYGPAIPVYSYFRTVTNSTLQFESVFIGRRPEGSPGSHYVSEIRIWHRVLSKEELDEVSALNKYTRDPTLRWITPRTYFLPLGEYGSGLLLAGKRNSLISPSIVV